MERWLDASVQSNSSDFFYPIEFDFETTDLLIQGIDIGISRFPLDASVLENGFGVLKELCFSAADDDGMHFELGSELTDRLILPIRGEGDFRFERCRVGDTFLAHWK